MTTEEERDDYRRVLQWYATAENHWKTPNDPQVDQDLIPIRLDRGNRARNVLKQYSGSTVKPIQGPPPKSLTRLMEERHLELAEHEERDFTLDSNEEPQ